MAATEVIYFPLWVQLDLRRTSPTWTRFRFPSALPSQLSPSPPLRSGANGTSLISNAGGDEL